MKQIGNGSYYLNESVSHSPLAPTVIQTAVTLHCHQQRFRLLPFSVYSFIILWLSLLSALVFFQTPEPCYITALSLTVFLFIY